MRKLSLFIVLAFLGITGIAQDAIIPYQHTIPIHEGDSKELIIEKAAHVVPTANQLAALRNEFIAFIHFGPNTFTRMEGQRQGRPKDI